MRQERTPSCTMRRLGVPEAGLMERISDLRSGIPIASFFTGGGFLDIGFELAGFDIRWTNEHNPAFANLFAHGMAAWRGARSGHIARAAISETRSIAELTAAGVVRAAFGERPAVFGVIGGPPCTDFSAGGLNSGHSGRHGRLMKVFVDLICAMRPTFFVIENVPGLRQNKKHGKFLKKFVTQLEAKGGYCVDMRLLNALEFGVPQDRDRLFVVGIRRHVMSRVLGRVSVLGEREWFPWPTDSRYAGAKQRFPWPSKQPFGDSPICPPEVPIELTVYSVLGPDNDPELAPNGKDCFRAHSHKFQVRAEGDVGCKSFKRLHRYRYSPTAWYGNNEVHLHPWKARRLSVREAMRVQSIPDEYVLPEGSPLAPKFKMICNGVPCRLAERVANSMDELLRPIAQAESSSLEQVAVA